MDTMTVEQKVVKQIQDKYDRDYKVIEEKASEIITQRNNDKLSLGLKNQLNDLNKFGFSLNLNTLLK